MKRLSWLLLACALGLWLAGCSSEKEKQYNQKVESNLATIETRLDHAIQAKNSLDGDLKALSTTADNLHQAVSSLRTSIDQLNASLLDLQNQVKVLRAAQAEYASRSYGWGFWQYLLVIVILALIGWALVKYVFGRKTYEEEEEEDFSGYDEDLSYEEPSEEAGGEESGKESRPTS